MEAQYLNRELDEKFGDIKDSLGRIENQTSKTNGRVNELEVQAKVARAKLNTAIKIFTFLIASIAIPLIASFIQAGKL